MANDMDAVRSTLNDLIETCKDSQRGFHDAAEKLQDAHTRTFFLKCSLERAEFAGELQAEVTRIGGEPATTGSTAGAIHRGWIGLKAALSNPDDHAVLEEAERGEDSAVKSYRDALAKDMPADINAIVRRQLDHIQRTHNIVRELRDGVPLTTSSTPMAGLR